MIVLDTTVLVYAVGEAHPFRGPCRDLVDAAAAGRLRCTTSVEVVQEFVHVRARRRNRANAVALGRRYAALFEPLLVLTGDHLEQGLRLYESATRLGAFDAMLAAAALAHGAADLVSADAGFGEVAGLSHLVPDAATTARLLAS